MLNKDSSTIILAGNNFNVSIFQQNWLLENNVLNTEDFSGENIFTPVVVNIANKNFTFLVVPERIQCTIKASSEDPCEIFKRTIGKIATTLEHTPVRAIGINFEYHIKPKNISNFNAQCKSMFICADNPLSDYFNSQDSRFGSYMSTDIEEFDIRLKLDIKPIITKEGNDLIRLNFNAHKNIQNMKDVTCLLDKWNSLDNKVKEISQSVDNKINS